MTITAIIILAFSAAIIGLVARIFFERTKTAVLTEQLNSLKAEKQSLESKVEGLSQQHEEEKELRIRAEVQVKNQEKIITDWEKYRQEVIQGSETAILKSARELSTKLLAEHKTEAKSVQQLGEKNLTTISKNLHDNFAHLIGGLNEFGGRLQQQESGLDILNRMLTEPQKMGETAELILENKLKALGLTEHQDFLLQSSFDGESGKLRPDAVIFLPDNNVIIVDSKSSPIINELAIAEFDDDIDEEDLKKKLKTRMRQHLKSLTSKEYISAVNKGIKTKYHSFSPNQIITLLWISTDGMLERIDRADAEFRLVASDLGITVVGPSALQAAITVASLKISARKQIENQAIIVKETGVLLQRIYNAFKHAEKAGKAFRTADNAFLKFAGSVNGMLLPKAKELINLGVSKPQGNFEKLHLPTHTQDIIEVAEEDEIEEITESPDHPDE